MSDDPCDSLLSAFAPDVPPEIRATLLAALQAASVGGASVELDPALDGEIELDPALSGVIEADPVLDGTSAAAAPQPDAEQPSARETAPADAPRDGILEELPPTADSIADAAVEAPDEVTFEPAEDVAHPTAKEKIRPEPTLRPAHALVTGGAGSSRTPTSPPANGDAAGSPADRPQATGSPSVDEPRVEATKSECPEPHEGAQPTEEEASMADSTMMAQTDEADEATSIAEHAAGDSVDVAPPAVDDEPGSAGASRPVADDLFEGVPRLSKHFMALLERQGSVTMPEVMAHLGLVRPKGVGGAIEPIQRLARLIDAEMPFEADFAPSGHKRWTWRAQPLSEVPADVREAIPAPPPQQKKPKKAKGKAQAERNRYRKAWKKALELKKRKGHGKRIGKGKPTPTAERRAEGAPSKGRDESVNAAGRAPRKPGPAAEGRRRRYDRPMPEVFRRTNRPPARPARREEAAGVDQAVRTPIESSPVGRRQEERPGPTSARVSPAAAVSAPTPAVPKLSRTPSEPPAAPSASGDAPDVRRGVTTPEERLPLPRSGVFRRRTVGDTDVPVVVIRRRKR